MAGALLSGAMPPKNLRDAAPERYTKLAASIRLTPVAAMRVHNSARTAGSRVTLSFCRPSRGPTSHTLISTRGLFRTASSYRGAGRPA